MLFNKLINSFTRKLMHSVQSSFSQASAIVVNGNKLAKEHN